MTPFCRVLLLQTVGWCVKLFLLLIAPIDCIFILFIEIRWLNRLAPNISLGSLRLFVLFVLMDLRVRRILHHTGAKFRLRSTLLSFCSKLIGSLFIDWPVVHLKATWLRLRRRVRHICFVLLRHVLV